MLDQIRIQNFKSIRDLTLKLQPVNLLIGPNNSGKSNLLNAFKFLSQFYQDEHRNNQNLDSFRFQKNDLPTTVKNYNPISYSFIDPDSESIYKLEFFGKISQRSTYKEIFGELRNQKEIPDLFDIDVLEDSFKSFTMNCCQNLNQQSFANKKVSDINLNKQNFILEYDGSGLIQKDDDWQESQFISRKCNEFGTKIFSSLSDIKVYNINPDLLKQPYPLTTEKVLFNDASNLISFLDNMRDSNPEVLEQITSDLRNCISDFKDIRFEKIQSEKGLLKKIGVLDIYKKIYWSDELSEGILYFLALLAILHQPYPPKLILLEEPEKGIHPHRIHEVLDYIFQLAEEKSIQVIMTTHSPLVVDEFKDIPEAIHIFEMEKGETKVKNLFTDVIEPSEKLSKEKDFPVIDYSKSLGDHWTFGFFGGVPK